MSKIGYLRRQLAKHPVRCVRRPIFDSIMQAARNEARQVVDAEIKTRRQELDALAQELVETGGALWENEGERHERLIVRGRSNRQTKQKRPSFPYKRAV